MKYNFENEYMTASTDSIAVAKRLILIIEDMEKLSAGKPDKAVEAYLEDDDFVNHCVKQQAEQIKTNKPKITPDTLDAKDYEKYKKKLAARKEITDLMQRTDKEIEELESKARVPEQIGFSNTGDIDSTVKPKIEPDDNRNKYPRGYTSSQIKPAEGTIEEAYMGEHFEVVPDEPKEKPLTPREKMLWEYIQSHPNYTMAGTCRDLQITTSNYYWLKKQLQIKGRPIQGVVDFAVKSEA